MPSDPIRGFPLRAIPLAASTRAECNGNGVANNPSGTISMRRRRDLDFWLARDGTSVAWFAKHWKVDVKTVRRDLKFLKEKGKKLWLKRDESVIWVWTYESPGRLFK
jgi:hypothetical protein